MQSKKTHLNCKPFALTIDPTNRCTLRCPACITGNGENLYPKGYMTFEMIKRIVDQLKDYVYIINLYNWGEPFLNRDLNKMVKYAHECRIYVSISTNLQCRNEETWREIVEKGCDHLIVCIDGASQETYSKYRVGGELDAALRNLKKIIDWKKKLRRKNPFIVWQYLLFEHNENELQEAEKIAYAYGVDFFEIVHNPSPSRTSRIYQTTLVRTLRAQKKSEQTLSKQSICAWLWYNAVFYWDGKVFPCCYPLPGYYPDYFFGDITECDFETIWNGDRYVNARQIFAKRGGHAISIPDNLCLHCWVTPAFLKKKCT